MRRDRYTVAFDEEALGAMETVTASTNYRDIPDFIRAAVTVMVDLLDAKGRKLTVVLRDDATKREWEYSPHEPGRAMPIAQVGDDPPLDNVFRPAFGRRRENEISLGASALFEQSAEGTQRDDAPAIANQRKRRKLVSVGK